MNLEAAKLAEMMPDEVKLVIVGLATSPPEEGIDIRNPDLIEFLDELVELGIALAVSSGTGRRFQLTRLGQDIFDIVKGQPCTLD